MNKTKEPKDHLERFLSGLAAAVELLNRAAETGSFVEYVCLATSVIDANLRMGLVLKNQTKTRSKVILVPLLYQARKGKRWTEKEIYVRARNEGIISDSLLAELRSLYEDRNKIVHRYIISEITTDEVLDVAIGYEKLIQQVKEAVYVVEQEQIDLGVGMTVAGPDLDNTEGRQYLEELAGEKHGQVAFALRSNLRLTAEGLRRQEEVSHD